MTDRNPRLPSCPARSGVRSPRAFTLIELLTVIAIIGILAAIIIPTVGKVRQTSRRAVCASNLRQTGLAVILYAQDNRDRFPGPLHSNYGPYPKSVNVTMLSHYLYGLVTGGRDIKAVGASDLSRVDIFACPAWDAQTPLEAQTANNGDARCYLLNLNVRTTRGNGQLWPPFGYPPSGADKPPTLPLLVREILNPARSWMITDYDAAIVPSASAAYVPRTPVHGSTRNAVFFDAHVESRPANTFTTNSDSFNY